MTAGTLSQLLPHGPSAERFRAAVASGHVTIELAGDGPRVLLRERRLSFYERVAKPGIDRVSAVVLLVLLAPVLGVVALAVRVTLGRGVIYRQQRVGRYGHLFTMYKFRTMQHDRRRRQVPWQGPDRRRTHKTTGDPRHTRLGRFLRRTSLDELPQLVNVLLGDMSLVGPRPELPNVVARHYAAWHHRRHDVRPGLTGLWQVTERDDEGMMYQHVALDLVYVASLSFMLDVLLLVFTVPALLGRPVTAAARRRVVR